MKQNLRYKALKQLARTKGETAQTALNKEVEKIGALLKTETQYDVLNEQLDVLEIIAFRVSGEAIRILKDFLARTQGELQLTYQESKWLTERYKEFYSARSLAKEALKIIERIRYHQLKDALDIFFEYSLSSYDELKKQADEGLDALAQFDLDIFWGNESFGGLRAEPQRLVLEKMNSLSVEEREVHFSTIVRLCQKLLSPTMDGTSWHYKTVTFKSGTIPAIDIIKKLRIDSLLILKEMYGTAQSVSQKEQIISGMQQATRPPREDAKADILEMISANTLEVLEFYSSLIEIEALPLVQKIEHDVFWIVYHRDNPDVQKAAFSLKAKIDAHSEYQIYKVLIGYEGIFEEWGNKSTIDSATSDKRFEKRAEQRKAAAKAYAEAISEVNFLEWKERIIKYSKVESNDLATFPSFFDFLEHFGRHNPQLALSFAKEEAEKLERFTIPILKGVFQTPAQDNALALMREWVKERKYLINVVRLSEATGNPDISILKDILAIGHEEKNVNLLAYLASALIENYTEKNKEETFAILFPVIEALTALKIAGWIELTWYKKSSKELLSQLDTNGQKIILDNLLHLKKIDYHAEDVLLAIAKQSPELVVDFFGKRLALRKGEDFSAYDAIPYDFHQLAVPLSKSPEKIVPIVCRWYNGDYSEFITYGGRLLSIIFPDFPKPFEEELFKILKEDKQGYMIVMGVLRNYEGQPFIHNICKELIKIIPADDKLKSEIYTILESTGVVAGEFGFVKAYEGKIEEIQPWLKDENEKIRDFAKNYISGLENSIALERKRVEESIELEKFEWGVKKDEESNDLDSDSES